MIDKNQPIKLLRDCEAELIPSGDKIQLIKGEIVKITQSLGGNYTLFLNGNLEKEQVYILFIVFLRELVELNLITLVHFWIISLTIKQKFFMINHL